MTKQICAALFAAVLAAACSSKSSTTGAGGTTSSTTATSTTKAASTGTMAMCIQPGDAGNSKGVGHYCTPGGGECMPFPNAPLCLADVGQNEWFCTRIGCDATTDCGPGAGCVLDPAGSACVPCKCDNTGIGCMGTTSSSSSSSSTSSSSGSTSSSSSSGSASSSSSGGG